MPYPASYPNREQSTDCYATLPLITNRRVSSHDSFISPLGSTYLLRRNVRVRVHALKHLGLGLAICGFRLDRSRVHARLRSILLLLGHVLRNRSVFRAGHVVRMLHSSLPLWHVALRGSRSCRRRRLSRTLGVRCGFLARDDINQEIEHVRLGEGSGDIGSLESSSLVILGVDPRPHRELGDEDITSLGEENRRFSRNHLHLRVCFHDLLDSCQGELVDLIVMIVILEMIDNVLPIRRQNISRLSCQSLAHL